MNSPQIKVLVVTYLPWSNDISVGNTLSNIFKGMEDRIEFANIYFREDVPDNDIVERFSIYQKSNWLRAFLCGML